MDLTITFLPLLGPPTQHWTPQAEGITPPHCVLEEPSKVCPDI